LNKEVHTATFLSITPDAEKQIVYQARVSNPRNQDNPSSSKLIAYLIKHKHWSPFEMASMQIQIDTTRAIAAQVLRHRSFSFQEFSQRYADVNALEPVGYPHLRVQDVKNKQASHDTLAPNLRSYYEGRISQLYKEASRLYQNMLHDGIAKECARSVLPLGTPTRLYMSGTIRSWIHYIDIRAGIETQLEHRLIAQEIKKIFCEQLPDVATALGWDSE
jgi:thymidylate synthase (FAD)